MVCGDQEACDQLDARCTDGNNDACRMKTNLELKDLCEAGNNGACNELYTRCEGGDAQACQALPVNKLGEKCQEGYGTSNPFNAACRELLRRCNEGNQSACSARRTCSSQTEQALNQAQDEVCNVVFTCGRGLDCPELILRMNRANACLLARVEVVTTCFQGIADDRHQSIIDDIQIRSFPSCSGPFHRLISQTDQFCPSQGYVAPTLAPIPNTLPPY